jgi:membrane protease YdiL (CAAX protease family)
MNKINIVSVVYGAIFLLSLIAMAILHGFPYPVQKYQTSTAGAFIAILLVSLVVGFSGFLTRKTTIFDSLKELFQNFFGGFGFFSLLWISLLSGFAEEALFRGVIQPYAGLIWTSFIFGILHIGPSPKFLPWTGFAVVMGFVLGTTAKLSDSLLVVSLIHTLVNFLNLLDLRYSILDFIFGPKTVC